MKKLQVTIAAVMMILVFSSCGQTENPEDTQTDIVKDIVEISKGDDETGKLTIQKTSDGYDISDYESESTTQNDKDTEHDSNDHSVSTADEKFIDYEALGIKEYEYPSEFIMGDNLKTALAQLASGYSSFDSDTVGIGGWKEYFINNFIQNSRLTFDYLDLISDQNNGLISIDQLNYIQYSLTNTEVDFSTFASYDISRYEAASPVYSGSISGYDYEDTDNGVLIIADLEVRYDGAEDTQKYKVTAELVRNPYSCFDGYSIAAFSSTIADNLQGDS